MMKFFSFIAAFLAATGALLAQNLDTIVNGAQLDDVVVTAQFAPQSVQNAIYKVKILHANTIHNKGATNLSELLQDEINIDLAQNSVFGSNVEIQGVSKENIKILIDGVPVIGRLNGIIDLSQINLANIERVEVVEGPVSVFYGTDAMGGIMNLVTKTKQAKDWEGSLSVLYESINAKTAFGNVGYQFGNNTIRLNLGAYQFDGLSTIDSVRSQNWPNRNDYFGDWKLRHNFEKLSLGYTGHLAKHALFTIGDPDRKGKIQDKDYFTQRLDNVISLKGMAFGEKYMDITASYLDYQRYHDTYDVDLASGTSLLSSKDTKDDNIVKYQYSGLKASLGKNQLVENVNYMFGLDVNRETSSGSRILDKKQSISTTALFGSLNYKMLGNIELQPGLRYTWNSTYGSLLSPAINAKWSIADNQKLRLSYARGFRAPTIKELYLDFHITAGPSTFIISGNEDLEVERSHSFNLQYTINKNLGDKKSLLIEPALFYNTISDLIDLSVMQDNKRHYLNVDKFKSVGGHLLLAYVPSSSLVLKIGYGNTGRYNHFSEKDDSDPLLYTPEVSSSIGWHSQKYGLHANAFYKYTGERTGFYYDKKTKKITETTKSDFNNLSITFSKDFFGDKLNIQVGGKNLFDVTDVEVTNSDGGTHSRNLQLWGRSYIAKATMKF